MNYSASVDNWERKVEREMVERIDNFFDADPYDLFRHEETVQEYYKKQPGEVIITDPNTGGMKGQKDVRLHAIPWEALAEVGKVYAFGESKYDDYNFRKGYKWSLSYDALQRHLGLFWNREDQDRESSLHHVAHVVWHGFTLLFFSLTGRGTDDRPE